MEKQEVIHYAKKVALGLIAELPGGAIFTAIMEGRSDLKTTRLLEFVKELQNSLAINTDDPLSLEHLNPERFGDTLEAILRRVAQTNSAYKLNAFRQILINQTIPEAASDHVDKYIQITEALSDSQFSILAAIHLNFTEYVLSPVHIVMPPSGQQRKKHLDATRRYKEAISPSKLGISSHDFVLETLDLTSKALIVDQSKRAGYPREGEVFSLTPLGKAYVEYALGVQTSNEQLTPE